MLNEIKPYFFYSPYNSIRMVQSVEWTSSQPKTVTNTLSFQEDGLNTKDFYQLYQSNDAVRNQFKSTYSSHVIKLYGCDESIRTITPIKKTNNLNIESSYDAYKTDVDGFLTVYFGRVNDNLTGQYVDFGQFTPEWMKAGTKIDFDTVGEIVIDKIVWLEDLNMYGLKTFEPAGSGFGDTYQVDSFHNLFDYDIYEFDIDFGVLTEGKYYIEITALHDDFDTVVYNSERLLIKDIHENTHHVIYENDKNNQINYSWGIQHMMRLAYESELKYSPEGENEIHKTDNNTFLLNSTTFENYEAELSPLPVGIAIKTTMATSLSLLFVDTRSYVCQSKPEFEKIGDTNLYDGKVFLTLSNEEYNDKSENFKGYEMSALLEDVDALIMSQDSNSAFVFAD